MNTNDAEQVRATVEAIYRDESRRVFATLIRLLGDFDRAEEALHDAFKAALEQWPRDGVPDEVAYRLARAIHRGKAKLAARLPQGRYTSAANTASEAPRAELLHPGVARYLREVGTLR